MHSAYSQNTIIMGETASYNSIQEAVDYFYDPGGPQDNNNLDNPDGNFEKNLDVIMTLKHSMNNNFVLYVYFDNFVMGIGDTLWIYDGSNTTANLIGVYNLVNSPGEIYASGAALTFRFKSDNVDDLGLSSGWIARVNAYQQVQSTFKFGVDQGTNYTCNAKFTDSGGENGNIANNNENTNGMSYVTFYSPAESHIKCEFTKFDCNGTMKIYDGPYIPGFPDMNGRLIGQFRKGTNGTLQNNQLPPTLFSSSHQLSFVYIGETNDKNKQGWEATITCVPELFEPSDGSPCPSVSNIPGGAYSEYSADETETMQVIDFDCSKPVILLEAKLVASGRYSNDYTFTPISEDLIQNGGARMFDYTAGVPIVMPSGNTDDVWLSEQNLPFKFNFFGNTYQKVYPSANGLMSFDQHGFGEACGYSYPAPPQSPPYTNTPYKFANSIYGVYEDIDPNNSHCPHNGTIKYGVVGSYPCRAFIFNYNNIGVYGNGSNPNKYNTYQMVFYEGTNIVDIFIKKRECCGTAYSNGEGIVGLQNKTSSQILIAPNRGMTNWTVIPPNSEGWRFTPITPLDEYGELTWYKNSVSEENIISHDPMAKNRKITVSPSETMMVISEYKYTNAANDPIVVYDTTLIKVNIPNITTSSSSGAENICPGEECSIKVTYDNTEYPNIVPQHYLWSTSENDTLEEVIVTPEESTMYYVTLTLNNNCVITDSVKVIVTELALPQITATDTILCDGESTTLIATHPTSNSFKWNNGATTPSITVTPHQTTFYKVEATMEGSCIVSDTLTIIVNPLPQPSFMATPTEIFVENGIGTVTCTDLSPDLYSLVWDFGDINSAVNIVKDLPTATHDYIRSGFYTITLTAKDDNGCSDSVKTRVSVTVPYFFYIPNALMPEGSGSNKTFAPKGEGVDPNNYSMQIYDRNGMIIFSTTNPYDSWDGKNKTGKLCPEGVYVYIIRLINLNGEEKEYTGTVTLVR